MGLVTLVFVFMLNGMSYEAEMDFLTMESCLQMGRDIQASDMVMMPAGCFQDAKARQYVRGEKV